MLLYTQNDFYIGGKGSKALSALSSGVRIAVLEQPAPLAFLVYTYDLHARLEQDQTSRNVLRLGFPIWAREVVELKSLLT